MKQKGPTTPCSELSEIFWNAKGELRVNFGLAPTPFLVAIYVEPFLFTSALLWPKMKPFIRSFISASC